MGRKAAALGAEPTLKRHLARRLASRFALRVHVVLILLGCAIAIGLLLRWAAPAYRLRANKSSTTGTTASSIRMDASGIVAA
ncbi:hypothetical protein LMG19083_02120 [Ralstonia psammae]|uniref:Transmembrane protein n=1 Tax=Ralstonia psammae TaxID=3058598 RepID=A0ABN9IWD6_9RALS|nr:hypothetical protein [Ralstonia sp. LMG 19083]CAJ0791241.1 hypothetical protein LMG19083_02120 [Ralstonia sp. LMG 19083]